MPQPTTRLVKLRKNSTTTSNLGDTNVNLIMGDFNAKTVSDNRRSLRDVRVKRCADVASDHHLVTARLKLKLKRNDVDQERRKGRYNVDYLKDQNIAQ